MAGSLPKYWVDWSKSEHPIIRVWDFDQHHPPGDLHKFPVAQSLTDCKDEIQNKANRVRQHWLEVCRQVRALRVGDFE